jgi:hypothetical protein
LDLIATNSNVEAKKAVTNFCDTKKCYGRKTM